MKSKSKRKFTLKVILEVIKDTLATISKRYELCPTQIIEIDPIEAAKSIVIRVPCMPFGPNLWLLLLGVWH